MILKKTTDIMKTGIRKFNLEFNSDEEKQAQIQITTPNGIDVVYKKSFDWQPKEVVKFTEIMDVKFDILNLQSFAKPVMLQSIAIFAEEFKTSLDKISVFIFNQNDIIGIAVYEEVEFKKSTFFTTTFYKSWNFRRIKTQNKILKCYNLKLLKEH